MTETEEQDVPTEEELDVEAPNESAPGHNPPEEEEPQDDE